MVSVPALYLDACGIAQIMELCRLPDEGEIATSSSHAPDQHLSLTYQDQPRGPDESAERGI